MNGTMTQQQIRSAVMGCAYALWPTEVKHWVQKTRESFFLDVLSRAGLKPNAREYDYSVLLHRVADYAAQCPSPESLLVLRAIALHRTALTTGFRSNTWNLPPAQALGLWCLDILPNVRAGLIDDHLEIELSVDVAMGEFIHLHVYEARSDRPPQPDHSHRFDVGITCLIGHAEHRRGIVELTKDGSRELLRIIDKPESSEAQFTGLRCELLGQPISRVEPGDYCELWAPDFHNVRPGEDTEVVFLVKFERNGITPIAYSMTTEGVIEKKKAKRSGGRGFTYRQGILLANRTHLQLVNGS
jgi:hypothetical protein